MAIEYFRLTAIGISAPAAIADIDHRACVCCCRQFYFRGGCSSISSSIGMQSSAAHGKAVAQYSAYSAVPTLCSNATMSMANRKEVMPALQAGFALLLQ